MVGDTVTVLYEPYGIDKLEVEVFRLEDSLFESPATITGYSVVPVVAVMVPSPSLLVLVTYTVIGFVADGPVVIGFPAESVQL